MPAAAVRKCFAAWAARNPHPTTELKYRNRYQLLIAVVMSAQTTDKAVNAATADLFARVREPQDMVQFGREALAEQIKTIGLFRTKAANVIALSELLIAEHGGKVPANREALEALPGVGRKTANVVLNTAFGQPTVAVDTHIFRVSNRTGIAPGKNPIAVEKALLARVPKDYLLNAHHWLILHGRYVCRARNPLCETCPIRSQCRYPGKTA